MQAMRAESNNNSEMPVAKSLNHGVKRAANAGISTYGDNVGVYREIGSETLNSCPMAS